jgi:hypothetical protein
MIIVLNAGEIRSIIEERVNKDMPGHQVDGVLLEASGGARVAVIPKQPRPVQADSKPAKDSDLGMYRG